MLHYFLISISAYKLWVEYSSAPVACHCWNPFLLSVCTWNCQKWVRVSNLCQEPILQIASWYSALCCKRFYLILQGLLYLKLIKLSSVLSFRSKFLVELFKFKCFIRADKTKPLAVRPLDQKIHLMLLLSRGSLKGQSPNVVVDLKFNIRPTKYSLIHRWR